MAEDYKARARQRAQELGSSTWLKLKEGDNILRLLPTPETKKSSGIWTEYGVHRDVGPKKQMVKCGKDIIKGEGSCWLCDVMIPQLRKKGKEARAAALEAKPVTVFQVARVTETDDDKLKFTGPHPYSPSKTVAAGILSIIVGSKKRVYQDPKKGYNFTINRTGTGKNDTKYVGPIVDEESSVVPESIIAKLKPFSELKEIPIYDENKQKAAYRGLDTVDDEDDEDDEDEKPTKKGKVGKGKGAARDTDDEDDDEDDEDEDDGDDEDEEEEVTPKGKKGKSKAKPEPDDDEDDEEEEEEEKPAKKGKAGKGKAKPEPEEEEDEDEDDDDEEEEVTPKGKKGGKGKAKPEPEDDDEGDDLDEDDEEEEKPKGKGGKGKAKPEPEEEEDEDEDDEDDEEEPEEKPKGKAKGGKGKAAKVEEPEEEEDEDDDPPPRAFKSGKKKKK